MLFSLFLCTVFTIAASSPIPSRQQAEPALSISKSTIATRITCVTSPVGSAAGGIVLLVHGTGSIGSQAWGSGPYVSVLPTTGQGYDVCYVDLPNRTVDDVQVTAEYVVAAVQYLAPQSKTGRVSLIGHSQGAGLNIPWALMWWPSIRPSVTAFIALAGDFHGTTLARFLCSNDTRCAPSVRQQYTRSIYLSAQNYPAAGSAAQATSVPTTSIFTSYDEIVLPQGPTDAQASSYLPGAGNFRIQASNVCGAGHFVEHAGITTDSAAFGLAKAALENPGRPAQISQFDTAYCDSIVENPGATFGSTVENIRSGLATVLTLATQQIVGTRDEPRLKPYVCARGFAPSGYSCSA